MFKNQEEKRFASGLLIGFFLATGLMFGLIQLSLGPYYGTLMNLKPQLEIAYAITHSDAYAGIQVLVGNVNTAAEAIAQIPIIGEGMDATKVPMYAQALSTFMESVRGFTESGLALVNFEIMLLQLAIPAILASIVMIAVGAKMNAEAGKKAKGKKSRKK